MNNVNGKFLLVMKYKERENSWILTLLIVRFVYIQLIFKIDKIAYY
jgi:hypothetical protein